MKNIYISLAFFIIIAILSSCMSVSAAVSGNPQKDHNFTIELIEMPDKLLSSFWAYVSFKGYDYLCKQEQKSAEAELRESDYSSIPKCGIIIIQLNGKTIDLAKGEKCVYVVRDINDNEILRVNGETEIPDFDVSDYGTRWYAYDIVPILDEIDFPIKIRIINKIVPDEYWEYLIEKKEK